MNKMKHLHKGDKVGIVCCSNGQSKSYKDKIALLENVLAELGLIPVFSDFIYEKDTIFSGTGLERAHALMDFYKDDKIKAIFDISGGDLANEVLPYLDFEEIAKSPKLFWGYSDLTTILNAIYTKTGTSSVLYQIRNLIYDHAKTQITRFCSTLFDSTNDLYNFNYTFIQGDTIDGIVVGGNIRCLLKLAGTPYWPDMTNKVLLLESFGGTVPQMTTYLNQLKQIGVFDQITGIILGTFTQMEEQHCTPTIIDLVKQYADPNVSIIKTQEIGHGSDSKAVVIGSKVHLKN